MKPEAVSAKVTRAESLFEDSPPADAEQPLAKVKAKPY
jgi:hypothetical protein